MPSLIDKPRLMEKLKKFHDYVRKNNGQIGTKQRGIDLNFNNACNLKCKYCFTNSPIGDHAKDTLDIEMVASIADQADELGIFEFDLQGGERVGSAVLGPAVQVDQIIPDPALGQGRQ